MSLISGIPCDKQGRRMNWTKRMQSIRCRKPARMNASGFSVNQWPNHTITWTLALAWGGNSNPHCGNIGHNLGPIRIDVSLWEIELCIAWRILSKEQCKYATITSIVLFWGFIFLRTPAFQAYDDVTSIPLTVTWQLLALQLNALMRPSTHGVVCVKTAGMHCKTKWWYLTRHAEMSMLLPWAWLMSSTNLKRACMMASALVQLCTTAGTPLLGNQSEKGASHQHAETMAWHEWLTI